MAMTGQFQLFPSPSKNGNTPFRKQSNRGSSKTRSSSPISLEDLKSDLKTESILIQIIKDTKAIIPPPQAHLGDSRSPAATPELSRNPKSDPNHGHPSRDEGWAGSVMSHVPQPAESILRVENREQANRLQQSPIESFKSPVVAMRSMFPRYNAQLPLNQQAYYPQNAASSSVPQTETASLPSTGNPVPPSGVDALLGPRTVPASIINFPTDMLNAQIRYSTAEELLTLWESANGQQLQDSLGTFNLRMERTDAVTFTFGDPLLPFYTLHTHSAHGFSIMRSHPFKSNRSVRVMAPTLEDRARRQPPHDGLVAVIFSKLAALLAVEQATELTRMHHLAPTEAVEVETHAVNRAAAQESCRLIWNARYGRYELQHPSLLNQHDPSLVGEDGNLLSRVQTKIPGTLHITVFQPSDSESDNPQPPTIIVTIPASPNAVEGGNMAASPRTSTLPLTDNDEPLASLDLGTMCLSICAGLTTSIIPSLYAIDSLVAAILAVAITDEATYPILADTEIYIPGLETPRTPIRRNRFRNSVASTVQTKATFSGKLIATLAEREDAEGEARLMAQLKSSKSTENDHGKRKSRRFFKFGRKRSTESDSAKTKNKNKQIVIGEFDLEKYAHYGTGSSREGQQIPGITRTIVRVMIWALEVVVAVLFTGVKCLAWLAVNVTRCVTSDKF